jgi:C4-dicarboxylate transporter DctM subunit
MSGPWVGAGGIVVMLAAMLLMGLEPGIAMAAVGFAGLLVLRTPASFGDLLAGTTGPDFWGVFANYGFTVIPLFVLLGEVIYYAGYSDKLFKAAGAWAGHRKGGLAITTILACAGFSAICGSNTATAATMSAVAMPAMRDQKYHPRLRSGAVAAGSTLGVMIPPSIVLVVYGLYTGQSVGKLFAGTIIPGLLLTTAFVATVMILCARHPDWAPAAGRSTWGERLRSVPQVLDIVLLFGIVMAALFSGRVTPTEAAGVGALLGIVVCVVRGRLTFTAFRRSITDTLRITSMVFLILAGATVFGRFLVLSRLPFVLTETVATMNLPSYVVFGLMLLCYVIGGCVMDALAFLLISLPLFMPLVLQMGYDPIWFGEVLCLVTTMGAITPPVGVSCFVVSGMARDVKSEDVFRGAAYFLPAYAVVFVLMTLLPHLTVGWLAGLSR